MTRGQIALPTSCGSVCPASSAPVAVQLDPFCCVLLASNGISESVGYQLSRQRLNLITQLKPDLACCHTRMLQSCRCVLSYLCRRHGVVAQSFYVIPNHNLSSRQAKHQTQMGSIADVQPRAEAQGHVASLTLACGLVLKGGWVIVDDLCCFVASWRGRLKSIA